MSGDGVPIIFLGLSKSQFVTSIGLKFEPLVLFRFSLRVLFHINLATQV